MRRGTDLRWMLAAVCLLLGPRGLHADENGRVIRLELRVTTTLPYPNTPIDPVIDFTQWIDKAGLDGVVDPNSIEVIDATTGNSVPHALTEDFAYSDQGRVEFVASTSDARRFEIHFGVVPERPPLPSPTYVPPIGTGDLLRYNTRRPGPITLFQSMGLHDVTGDGRADLLGTWNYYYRPGSPTGGVVFYPSLDDGQPFTFGDLQRLRFRTSPDELHHFSRHYNSAAIADFNRDGRIDFVYTGSGLKKADFYLATDTHDRGGAWQFEHGGSVATNGGYPCRAVDLNNDGAVDLVIKGQYLRNTGPGWPFEAAEPVSLDAGKEACFADIDGDGRVDAIGLVQRESSGPSNDKTVQWRRNLGGDKLPEFAPGRPLPGIDFEHCTMVSAATSTSRVVLLVQTNFQEIHAFEQTSTRPVRFERRGRAESPSAVMSLGDQAWPCLCDWDDDGDLDLLIGGGFGWPRIVLNEGTRTRPAFTEPREILANGKPIRLIRNEILGPPANWHNMGYPYPDFVDWNGDGLKDLMLPNETNRLYWYPNVGTKHKPRFAERRQIVCDGYPDSAEMRARSQRRANDPNSNNGVYPLEDDRPFFWRTGVAFADFTGDGLMDFATMDGLKRQATLFTQYRNADNSPKLRRDRTLKLSDGRTIDDRIVDRGAHWGESLRAIDWDSDGLMDLIYGVGGSHHGTKDGGSIYLLRNVGTKHAPVFAAPVTMRCFGEPIRITNHGPHPWPGDFDGDGHPDLLTCVEWSVYPYYSHAALMMKQRPQHTLRLIKSD